jgi:hypothetical protein
VPRPEELVARGRPAPRERDRLVRETMARLERIDVQAPVYVFLASVAAR